MQAQQRYLTPPPQRPCSGDTNSPKIQGSDARGGSGLNSEELHPVIWQRQANRQDQPQLQTYETSHMVDGTDTPNATQGCNYNSFHPSPRPGTTCGQVHSRSRPLPSPPSEHYIEDELKRAQKSGYGGGQAGGGSGGRESWCGKGREGDWEQKAQSWQEIRRQAETGAAEAGQPTRYDAYRPDWQRWGCQQPYAQQEWYGPVHTHCNPQYHQSCSGMSQDWLTWYWQAGATSDVPQEELPFNPNATPFDTFVAAQTQHQQLPGLRSVGLAKPKKRQHRVNKHRSGPRQSGIDPRYLDPSLFTAAQALPQYDTKAFDKQAYYDGNGMPRLLRTGDKPNPSTKKKNKDGNLAPRLAQTDQKAQRTPQQPKTELPIRDFSVWKPASPSKHTGKKPHLKLLKRPDPTWSYNRIANCEPVTLDDPRRLLVVIDLNGTLLYRKNRGSTFTERPCVREFLHYLLANHKILVWSSARRVNVDAMCKQLFSAEELDILAGIWAREQLRLTTTQFNQRVQVYKQLSWVWRDDDIQTSRPAVDEEWDQSNTVLLDDSFEKAASEPHNLLEIEEFQAQPEQMKTDVLGQVVLYLEKLRRQRDVSSFIKRQPFRYEEGMEGYHRTEVVHGLR